MKKLYPLIVTQDIKATAAFYIENFGFQAVFEQDWYIQILHADSGVELAFMVPNAENQPKELHPAFAGQGLILSLEVEDAEAEYAKVADKLDFVVKLRDEEWGQRHFIVRDPAGTLIDVVQQLGELDELGK